MRKLYVLFLMLLACAGVSAQNDNHKISYQAVVRNAANQLMYDTDLTVAVELANSENGPAVYAETHAVHSNANGLISLLIGDGTYVSGSWDAIHWNAAWVKATISKSGTTLAVHHLPLTAVPFALYADQVNPAALADYLTENHYLTEEVQVLSISHDTVFLTGGSFVKLPAGFSGNYNDLTNKPLKSDLCDSVKECVTGWISDSTRMVYDSLHTYYATTNALKDSLTRYVGIEKLNDTLEHYLQAGALCDSLVKCEVVQNMRDSIRTNATAIAALRDADAALSTRIQNDSANLVDFKTKVKADSITLATRIFDDSTALHNALTDTASAIRSALGDTATAIRNSIGNGTLTIVQGTTELGTFTANQMGNSNITIPTPAEQAQSDWKENNASDPAYIQNKPNIRDSVNRVVLDSLSAANSAMNRAVDTIVRNNIHDSLDVIRTKILTDSLDLVNRIVTDSTALVNRIVADGNALAHRMDTLLTHVCDSVETCVKGWISDSTRMVYDSLHTYYVNTNILRDTAAAIRGDIPDVSGFATKDELRADSTVLSNRIVTDSTVLANRIVTDSLALADKMHADSLTLATRMDTVYKHLCDSVMACDGIQTMQTDIRNNTTNITALQNKLQSDSAALADKMHADSTALVNRIVTDSTALADKMHVDSLDLVNRIVTDSTALVNRIVADSNALAHRMDTLLTHVCDSVETCVKGWISDSTRMIVDSLGAYYDTTLVKKAIHDTADVLRSMMTDAANDAKITIRKNGEEVGDFTVNQAADKTINIPVPTTVAEMTDASDYVKTTKLNDTLSKYATTNALKDSLTRYVGIEKLNDTLEHYLQAGALCDSLVKCEVVQNMRDSIRTNATAIAALRDADAALSTRIQNDSANLVDFKTKVKADSTTLANRIVTDSTALVNRIVADSNALTHRMDTLLTHVCDSVETCVKGWISDSTRMVYDSLHTYYVNTNTLRDTAAAIRGDIPDVSGFATKDELRADSTVLANRIVTDSTVLANRIVTDSTVLANRIVTDSTALVNRIVTDSLALVNRIVTDSTALHNALTDTASAIRGALGDTAAAIRNSIGNGTLTIVQGTTELGTFTANQMGNSSITIPTPAEQAQSDWKENNASDPAYIRNKPNIRDSVNRVMLDSLSAANSAMNRAVDTIVRNNIHDSLDVIRTKIHTDSLDLVNRIVTDSTALADKMHADSLTLATRMDTVYKHLCDSVMACDGIQTMQTDITNNTTNITVLQNKLQTDSAALADKIHSDSLALVNRIVTDSTALVNRIVADSNALAHRMDTLLTHVCDSVETCVKGWISDSTRMVYDSLHTYYVNTNTLRDTAAAIRGDIPDVSGFATKDELRADSTVLANRIVTDSTVLANRIVTDSTALVDKMHADSLDLVNRIVTDSTALVNRIVADSNALAHRMDTLLKHVCDSVKPCVTEWMSDTLKAYTTTDKIDTLLGDYATKTALADSMRKVDTRIKTDSIEVRNLYIATMTKVHTDSLDLVNRIVADSTALHKAIKDTAAAIRNDICDSATVCITKALADPTSEINHAVDTIARNNIHDTAEVLRSQMPVVNDGQLSISVNGGTAQTFTANQSSNTEVNISVPTCDDLADCLLIQDILARLDRLERQNDSLAREIDKMKPALTVTGPEETTVCLGSSKPVTYTATFHNCSSSDYTLAWKVNGVDSSNVTASKLIVNVETAGQYEVVCIATRSDNTTVSDTVTTTVTVDSKIPHFIATANNLTVTLSEMVYTDTIQWDTDSVPVPFSGTTAEHTYAVADTITITATSEGGCTYVYGLRLQAMAPAVTTVSVPDETITATTAIANGTVTFDGGVPSTKRGMVFSATNQHPELDAEGVTSVMDADTGMGNFACELKQLIPCTQYYVCAFAFNEVDTVYGDSVITFTTPSFTCGSTLTDIDGNEYATLLLGSQCWMKENLRTTRFSDGTEIPKGGSSSSSVTQPYYYEPDSNIATYGRFYNWAAAMHGSASSSANPSGVQGVCPDGWHLPSDAEWTQLTSFVASKSENVCDNNPAYIAKALASNEGWGNWGTSSIACLPVTDPAMTNNKTQFSVLPAGTWEVGSSAGYKNHGHSIFRTATEYEQVEYQAAYAREFYNEHAYVDRTAPIKEVGYSVRCVLDCAGQTYMPTVSVVRITNTGGTLSMAASVVSDGGENVTERGVCWGTASQPTITSDHAAGGSGIGEFSVTPTLAPGATYYIRAYATNSKGTAYGAEVTFVMPDLPTVTTIAATDVTASTAVTGGNVTADGGASVTARGVCWSTSPNPTVSDSHTIDGVGTGSFTSSITGLSSNITYYVRAYATNAGGTSYGSQVSFTTTDVLPKVTTSAVSNISGTTDITATCGGIVTDMGLDNVTARGVCWSTSQNPTISDSHTTDGSGLGSFTSNITSLTAGATYYVRAYATNSAGTAYGNQVNFTVPLIDEKSCPDAPTVTDHEGNVYATVKIGDKCWMRENLRTTTSPKTGTYLVNTQHKTGGSISSYKGSKVAHWYMNDSTTYAPMGYGLLYNWCAAMDTANSDNYMEVPTPPSNGNNTSFVITVTGNHRGICPVGWHLPSFQELNNGLPKTSSNLLASGNNTTGFTALLVGDFNGSNFEINTRAYFWSSMNLPNIDQSRPLYLTSNRVQMVFLDKNYGASVRCVRD